MNYLLLFILVDLLIVWKLVRNVDAPNREFIENHNRTARCIHKLNKTLEGAL